MLFLLGGTLHPFSPRMFLLMLTYVFIYAAGICCSSCSTGQARQIGAHSLTPGRFFWFTPQSSGFDPIFFICATHSLVSVNSFGLRHRVLALIQFFLICATYSLPPDRFIWFTPQSSGFDPILFGLRHTFPYSWSIHLDCPTQFWL